MTKMKLSNEEERAILIANISKAARLRAKQARPGIKCIIVQPGRITRDEINGVPVAVMSQDHMSLNGVPVFSPTEKRFLGHYSREAILEYILTRISAPETITLDELRAMEDHFFPHFFDLKKTIKKINE